MNNEFLSCNDKSNNKIKIRLEPFIFDEADNEKSMTYKSLVKLSNDYESLVDMLGLVGKILYYLPTWLKKKIFIDDLKSKTDFKGYLVYDDEKNVTIGFIDMFKLTENRPTNCLGEYNLGWLMLTEYRDEDLIVQILAHLIEQNSDKTFVITTLANNSFDDNIANKLNFKLTEEFNMKILFKNERMKIYKKYGQNTI